LECLSRFAESRLEAGAATVPCPVCNTNIAERVLKRLLPSAIMERLLQRGLEQAVSSAADLRACPTPDCPMRVALEEGGPPRLRCPLCHKTSCLRCGAQPYHSRLTCEKYAERIKKRGQPPPDDGEEGLRQWMKETGSKQCPTCSMVVTKENLDKQATQYSECHKMMCRNCDTKFCFKCLAVLTSTFTCKCTRQDHGFIDPKTGKRVVHLRGRKKR